MFHLRLTPLTICVSASALTLYSTVPTAQGKQIVKVKDISTFAAKISNFMYVIVTNHIDCHGDNLQPDREKTGKCNLSGDPQIPSSL